MRVTHVQDLVVVVVTTVICGTKTYKSSPGIIGLHFKMLIVISGSCRGWLMGLQHPHPHLIYMSFV